MDVAELTQAVMLALPPAALRKTDPYDHKQAYVLLGKILGVLIRKSRLEAERTPEDCARYLQLAADEIEAWELGECMPSLPQLESLAQFLNDKQHDSENGRTTLETAKDGEYLLLRQRLIGAMLRSVRQAQAQSVEELSNRTDLGPDVLGRYELGEQAIPFTHLSVLAQVLSQDLSYFRETLSDERDGDPIAKVSRSLVEDENAGEERPTADEHAALIRLAIAFRDIDRQNLQRVSDALSALIMARDASGPVGGSD